MGTARCRCHLDGGVERLSWRDEAVQESPIERLVGVDAATGVNHLERPPEADDVREPLGTAVEEWNPPSALIAAEEGVLGSDADVTERREL